MYTADCFKVDGLHCPFVDLVFFRLLNVVCPPNVQIGSDVAYSIPIPLSSF